METLAVALGFVLAVFAGVLTLLAVLAWLRFGERRFLLVGTAFLLVSLLAILAVVAELGVVDITWFDEAFALEPVPLALLLLAVLLIYGAMGGRRRSSDGFHDARA